jgi:uncharacterized protein
MTDVEYKTLNPKCKSAMYVKYAILLIIFIAAVAIIEALFIKNDSVRSDIRIITALIFTICLVYSIVGPIIFYRRYKYILTQDKVDIRRGIIIVRHTLVPIERIHQVEVVSGPINNMFGLADVNITTAGGTARIEFLEKDEADKVAIELNAVVEKILKDRMKNE